MVDWDGEVVLSTPRLLLRTFRRDDRLLYAALNADPEVARYLGGPLSREDSDDIAAWAQECYSRDRLAHQHWGRGYATEAATGWLDHAFGTLGLPRVISITDPPNRRSLAVMRRLGMVFDHEAEVEDNGVTFQAVVYTITADRWHSRPGRRGTP